MSEQYQQQQVKDAISTITNALNVLGSGDDVAHAIAQALSSEHRTLQQDFARTLQEALRLYALDLDRGYYDDRNAEALRFARGVSQLEHYFPRI